MVANFALTLSILSGISLLILAIIGFSLYRSKDKLTSFEKKILFFVAFLLCFSIIAFYIYSNFELFVALLRQA